MMMTLGLAHQLLPDSSLVGDPATPIMRVHLDTRSVQAGDLFIALQGERFDGHAFLSQAKAGGAVAALVAWDAAVDHLAQAGLAGLVVKNISTKQALGVLAQNWRAYLAKQRSIPIIAVTGSNGKTTVCQMVGQILKSWQGDAALVTQGNLNNDIGVPLTLLRLRPFHRCAVIEMGMNHPGEIAALAQWVRPTVALVNNAQREHQEFMDSVQAVAIENATAFAYLPASGGVAVFPAGDAFTDTWRALAQQVPEFEDGGQAVLRHTVTFGWNFDANVQAQCHWQDGAWQVAVITTRTAQDEQGEQGAQTKVLHYDLHMAGRHNVLNSLAAVACAQAAGVPADHIEQGLKNFRAVAGRSCALQFGHGVHAVSVVDDTYNANPDSCLAAIDMLLDLPAPHLLVLGDMGEVGQQGPAFHAEVGRYAKARGVDLWTLGAMSEHAGGRHFSSMEDLLAALTERLFHAPADVVSQALEAQRPRAILVKGSRFMKMERVIHHLQNSNWQNNEEGVPAC